MAKLNKNALRRILPASLRRAYRNIKLVFSGDMEQIMKRLVYDEKGLRGSTEHLLRTEFQSIVAPESIKAEINRHEFKIYSQYREDGILLYIFSLIGTTKRNFVEFGVSDGRECLTANLSLNFGWSGLLIEGDPKSFKQAQAFYKSMLTGPASSRVKIINAMVTAENINELLLKNEVSGEIDLLSIDIDGNDYWVWKAITAINPRVVVIEYNGILGNSKPITISYQPNFDRFGMNTTGNYFGTSLPAAAKLAAAKGYIFVGCESSGGVNAFFVRKDVAEGKISAVTTQQGFYPQARRAKDKTMDEIFAQIKHLPFEEV